MLSIELSPIFDFLWKKRQPITDFASLVRDYRADITEYRAEQREIKKRLRVTPQNEEEEKAHEALKDRLNVLPSHIDQTANTYKKLRSGRRDRLLEVRNDLQGQAIQS